MSTLDIMNIVTSFILIALLITMIVKKADAPIALISISFFGIVYFIIVNKVTIVDNSTGSLFFDIFAYIESAFRSQIGNTLSLIMVVLGYISYLEHIKATTLLCLILAKPLKKIKQPLIVVIIVMAITVIMKLTLFSSMNQTALILATLYPVMMALGVSKATAVSAIGFSCWIIWGPASAPSIIAFSTANITDITVTEYFVQYETVNVVISFAAAAIVFYITSKIFDKKENAQGDVSVMEKYSSPRELGIPYYYAIFPLLPIILVIIFSKIVVGTIVITVMQACLFSFLLVIVLELLRRKDKAEVINETKIFWQGMGKVIWLCGGIIIGANLFAGVLTKIGGLNAFFAYIANSGSMGERGFAIFTALLGALFTVSTGSATGAASLLGAVVANYAAATGASAFAIMRTILPVSGIAATFTPICPSTAFVAGQYNVPIVTVIKRMSPATVTYMIVSILVTQFIIPV